MGGSHCKSGAAAAGAVITAPSSLQLLALALDGRQGPAALGRAGRELAACGSLRRLLGPEPPPGVPTLRWQRLRAMTELIRRAALEELAERLELTRERVRQIQLEALGQLRRILRRRGISRDALL